MGGNTNRPNMPGQFQQFQGSFQPGSFQGNFPQPGTFGQGNFAPNLPLQSGNFAANYPQAAAVGQQIQQRQQDARANFQPTGQMTPQQMQQLPNLPTLGGPTMPLITNGMQQVQTAMQNLPNGAPAGTSNQLQNIAALLSKLGIS